MALEHLTKPKSNQSKSEEQEGKVDNRKMIVPNLQFVPVRDGRINIGPRPVNLLSIMQKLENHKKRLR